MRIEAVIILLFFISFSSLSNAQSADRIIQKGNDYYKEKKYSESEAEYNKVARSDSSYTVAQNNLANTLYQVGQKEKTVKIYDQLISNLKDSLLIADLYYNEGVVFSSQQNLDESIAAYENALLRNPDDKETRENLQKALLELKKKNPPKENLNKNRNDQQKEQSQPRMNQKQAEQKLKQLEQKEKELQQRVQKEMSKGGASQSKDW